MPELFCVRAEYGHYAENFRKGGYVGIGWFDNLNLSTVKDRGEVYSLYPQYHPEDTSPYVIGQQVGQIARFLFEIKQGDYVVTPTMNPEYVYWGQVKEDAVFYQPDSLDGCPFPQRKSVEWSSSSIQRSRFSVPLQYSLRSSLTVFLIKHKKSFFEVIGIQESIPEEEKIRKSYKEVILERIMELDDREFEILVTELLRTLGFEAEHTGKSGDQGVDVEGVLNIYNIAQVKLYVQVKRYNQANKINPGTVRALRQNIPQGAQGAFITTSDFQQKALDTATEQGFARIGTVNGSQLVDLLSEKWEELEQSDEIRDLLQKLALKRGLILDE